VFSDIGRRTVLGRVAAAVAALPVASAQARRKHKKKKKGGKVAFRLVTGCGGNAAPPCACNACEKHAANKIFASEAAVVRAHIKCNCRVETLRLPPATWSALFEPPGLPPVSAVDRRDARVQQILS
jgi:hypothetical protein